jgi:putative spermidine/putrescine transport system permease protein
MTTQLERPADTASGHAERHGVRRELRSRAAGLVLLVPALVAFALLFVYPLARMVHVSLTDPTSGFGNYTGLLSDGYTVRVIVRTLWVAALVAVLDLLLAFPFAYAMTICGRTMRAVLFTIVLVPFWTSAIAKNFAWLILFQRDGLIDRFASVFGIHYPLLGTLPGVLIAMTQVLLPFAVLPLYARLEQIDRGLLNAAQGLGATRARAFWRIYLPLSAPGLAAAGSLIFILSLGFYITPALLGSPQQTLVAQLIMIRIQQVLDFGGASAVGIFLLLVTLLAVGASKVLSRRGATSGSGSARAAR